MAKFCPNCGAELQSGDKFCKSCGQKTDSSTSAPDGGGYVKERELSEIFLKTSGRLNRLRYFKRSMAIALVEIVILIPIIFAFSDIWGNLTTFGSILTAAVILAGWVPYYCLMVRRMHDLNKDNTLAIVSLGIQIFGTVFGSDGFDMSAIESVAYLINGVIALYMLFAPGTKGDNQYGEDPLA